MVVCALAPSMAFAATKTVKTQEFSTTTSVLAKKATAVKKGTTKVVVKSAKGYVKFKAPSAKTYSFTISNAKGEGTNIGFATLQTPLSTNAKYCLGTRMKTKGGKSDTLWFSVNGHKFDADAYTALNRPLASRTGKVKLAKGQMAYLYFYTSTKNKTTLSLKVK